MFVNMTFVCVQVHNYGCRVKLFNVHKFQKAERFVCSAESPDRLWVLPMLLIDVNPAFFWGGGDDDDRAVRLALTVICRQLKNAWF